jgi:hypothetical protein
MSEEPNTRSLLEQAERAAMAGDFASADELLKSVARIQEAELGSLHPDLTQTLNNLAIVAEKTGQLRDAETFYRRAAAIASASLPPDHPIVADSRKNLEDFCRERGLPIEAAAPSTTPLLVSHTPAPAAPLPLPAPPRRTSRTLAWGVVAIGVAAVIAGTLLVRQDSSRETATPVAAAPPAATKAAEPPIPPPVMTPSVETAVPPKAAPRGNRPRTQAGSRRAATPMAAPVSLTAVELCQTFSTSGGRWRCDAAGDPMARGRIVLYTRVRSPRNGTVVHRWYRGGALQQSVRLPIRASSTDGYRTYSRQTIDSPGRWRVEVRSAGGDLLFEKSFAVR